MKKFLGIAGLGSLLLAGGYALAQPQASWMGDANNDGNLTKAEATAAAEARFAKMDVNNDGQLTKEDREAAMANRQAERFAKMDANSDGAISRAEWDQANAERKAKWEARRAAGGAEGRGGHWGRHRDRMAMRADTNNDQALSKTEFLAAATQRFDRADANKDGVVTAAERQAQWAKHKGHGPMPVPAPDDDGE